MVTVFISKRAFLTSKEINGGGKNEQTFCHHHVSLCDAICIYFYCLLLAHNYDTKVLFHYKGAFCLCNNNHAASILLWNYDDGILWHTCVMKKNILGLCNEWGGSEDVYVVKFYRMIAHQVLLSLYIYKLLMWLWKKVWRSTWSYF